MITKLLEAFFRHKLLLLLPPLLIPAIVSPIAVLSLPPLYDASVGVWVDHPTYLNYKDGSNPYITPVQNESGRLSELLHTRAFVLDVAQRTSLAPLAATAAGQARIDDLMSRSVTIGGATTAAGAATNPGEHLLVVHVTASTAQLSYELCKAIVDAYQEKISADQADQATVAVDFYQARVQDAQQQLNTVSQGLRRYVAAHQTDNSVATAANDPSQTNLQATLLDPKLATLETSVQTAQVDFNNSQSALTQAQQDAQAAAQGQQYGFQVLDPPQLPTVATPQTKKIIIFPIAAAIAGLGLSAMLLVLLVASDRSVRSEADLAPGLRVLGVVPTLKLKRVPKQLRGVATRRAIGAIAGTALPASSGAE
jgi:uncharacterized protein involved in exopolysaccharide biosynthesis